MSFTKAIKKKSSKHAHSPASKPAIDISKLISGEPVIDENSILELNTDQVINKRQVRTEFDSAHIEELGASMVELGQIQPIVVSPANKDGKFEIQKGECRWRAAKLKGIKIKAIIETQVLSEIEIVLGELAENIIRKKLKPLEIAVAIKELKDGGMNQGAIAKKMAKNDAFITRHLKLLEMPECVKQLYLNGVISDVQTLNNLTKLYSMNPERVKGLCQSVPQTGLSRKQSSNFVKEEGRIGKAVGKADIPASTKAEASPTNARHKNFAHVQNFSQLEAQASENIQPAGLNELAIDEPLEQKSVERSAIDNASGAESAHSTLSAEEPTPSDDDDDDGMLFRDGRPGMFGIEVKLQSGQVGLICLDRKDTDAEYIWVEIATEKMRVHIDQISIIRTVG